MSVQARAQMPFSGERQVSPWDSMLTEVRRSEYRAQWVETRIESEAQRERALLDAEHDWEPDDFARARFAQSKELRDWIKLGREERAHCAQVARAAVSAGLSERYIESVQAEAKMIASVLSRALDAAQLSDDQRMAAHEELRVALAEVGRALQDRHAAAGNIPVRPELEG